MENGLPRQCAHWLAMTWLSDSLRQLEGKPPYSASFLLEIRLLLPEGDGSGVRVHGVHNGQRFQPITQIPDDLAAEQDAFTRVQPGSFFVCVDSFVFRYICLEQPSNNSH